MSTSMPKTLLDALQASFAVSLRSPDGVADPVALLWTDSGWSMATADPDAAKSDAPDATRPRSLCAAEAIGRGQSSGCKCIVERTLHERFALQRAWRQSCSPAERQPARASRRW